MPVEQKKKIMYIIVGIISAIIFFFWAYEMSHKIKTAMEESKKNKIEMPVGISEIKGEISDINKKIKESQKLYDENIEESTTEQEEDSLLIKERDSIIVPVVDKDQEIIENMEKALEKIINTTSTTTQ